MSDSIEYKEVQWALREMVEVTLISHDPDGLRTTYLVTRIMRPVVADHVRPWDHALVLQFGDGGEVVINGSLHTSDDLIKWAELVDAVSLSPHFPDQGDWVTTEVQWQ